MKKLLTAALLVACSPAVAKTVVFDFTLTSGFGTVTGDVTIPLPASTYFGYLTASSVLVTSNTAGFGLGDYAHITPAFKWWLDSNTSPTAITMVVFDGFLSGTGRDELQFFWLGDSRPPSGTLTGANGFQLSGPVTFTLDPAPVPGPVAGAGLPALLAGFAAFGCWWRRRYASVPSSQTTR